MAASSAGSTSAQPSGAERLEHRHPDAVPATQDEAASSTQEESPVSP